MFELPFRGPSVCLKPPLGAFVVVSHARPAALDEAGGAPANRPAGTLGELPFFLASFGPLKVVSITRPPFLSGLGVLEVFFAGTGNVGGGGLYGVEIEGRGPACRLILLADRSGGESEFFVGKAGRCGRGGGRERSG